MTTRRLVAAVTASLSLSLAGIALTLGVADLASVSANVWMKGWEEQGYVNDPEQWNAANGRLNLARRLNPLSADHSADLGRLLDWQSLHQPADSARFAELRERARRFHAEAVGKRPTWGYAWAHYAEDQMLLGNRGDEFLLAMEKAIVLAPWEPRVQVKVAWIGIASWDGLPDRIRLMLVDSIRRTIETDSSLIHTVRMAIQYDWLDNLIPLVRTERQQALLDRVIEQAERR
jgi:hypothetical protein